MFLWTQERDSTGAGTHHSIVGGVHNHDLQKYKWKSLWLYIRLLDVRRFFDNFAALILPRPNYFLTHPIKMRNFKVVLPEACGVYIQRI